MESIQHGHGDGKEHESKFIPIHVNNTLIKAKKQVMTGREIKQAAIDEGAGVSLTDRLFMVIPGGNPKPVGDDEPTTLAPGMHFRTMVDGNLG